MPQKPLNRPTIASLSLAVALTAAPAWATDVSDGGPVLACPPLVDWTDTDEVLGPVDERGRAVVEADELEVENDGVAELSGEVLIEQPGRRIEAGSLRWDRPAGEIEAEGGITLTQDQLRVRADSAYYDMDDGSGSFHGTEFVVPERRLRGTADGVRIRAGAESHLDEVMITSCREGDETWRLVSPELELDHEAGVGTGRNVRVLLGPVPIFYSPYLSFPLDGRRKSGLLAPGFGSSTRRGTEISLPVYWNIAPNMDATLTPFNMTARGAGLEGEFRYLGARNTGQIEFAVLPDDDQLGISRERYAWDHRLRAGDWRLRVDATHVGDPDYLVDISDSLDGVTPAHLRRNATLTRRWATDEGGWRFDAVLESWQTLDPTILATDQPYRRVPDLRVSGSQGTPVEGLDLLLDARLSWFDRSVGPVGGRLDLTPGLRWRGERPGMRLESILDLRYTAYELGAQSNPVDRSPSRTVPRFSLDGRLIFERDAGDSVSTLEPRVMYLHIPYEDQSTLPVFDTAEYTLDTETIFRRDRFVGGDRVGDADQITLGITHRSFDAADGRERYAFSIGQVFHFSDRRITESGLPETEDRSNLVAGFVLRPGPAWRLASSVEWDESLRDFERASISLRYAERGRILNLSHRVLGATTEQSDASFSWPLSARLSAVGRLNYDHDRNLTLERFAGLEYRTCCWAIRVVARSYLVPGTNQRDDSVFLQLVLEGLTSLGGGTEELLTRGILGYSAGD